MRGLEECQECGDSTGLAFECNGCGERHCSTHQLPENHDCPAVGDSEQSQQWFTGPSSQQNRQAVHDGTVEPREMPRSGDDRQPQPDAVQQRDDGQSVEVRPGETSVDGSPLDDSPVDGSSAGLFDRAVRRLRRLF